MDQVTTLPAVSVSGVHGVLPHAEYQTAIALAHELMGIQSLYGDECVAYVEAHLRYSADPSWDTAIYRALRLWVERHPRFVLDLDS